MLVGLAMLVGFAACSAPERVRPTSRATAPTPVPAAAQLPVAPGLRLPDGVTPLHYDLTLDVDPDRETFAGEVRVRVRLDRATDHIWIHADQLDITSARYDDGPLTPLPVAGDQMRAFGFGKTLAPRDVTLVFAYTGTTTGDQEGLFRQRRGGRWYLFSQGEAVFARRITPCFDEPRFKTPWRVTLVVPRDHVALANTSDDTIAVDGSRKRIAFAESPVMPSYLLAIAVGPFDLVDVGRIGKNRIPLRVAVRAGAGKQVDVVASKLPAIVDAIETYLGEPLPLTKLDLVGVPEFFGAMENPGLITFEESMLVGKESKARISYFTHVAAHEIAHQWFGNSVTPAWWDDLWLSESFASWLGDKVTRQLGGFGDEPLRDVLDRRSALEADAGPNAMPLRRSIAGNADPDDAFDAIAYQKGEAVIATFEALVGADAFRELVRTYLRAHRDATATTADVVTALAGATRPEVGTAFEQYATLVGAPVVDLALRCDGTPTVVASARDRRLVPACVRYAGGKSPVCALVADRTELALGTATCPAWIDGNASAGYYSVHWQGRSATERLAKLDPASRVIAGDDLAAAVRRGELPASAAIAELRVLLASNDDSTHFGAVALARELDELVDDATRPAWSAWLAARLPKRDRKRGHTGAAELHALLPADRAPAAELRKARTLVDKLLERDEIPAAPLVSAFLGKDGDALFDRVVDKARATTDRERRDRWLHLLGAFSAALAERTAALATDRAELPIEPIWAALEAYFERPAARGAAWRALRARLDTFIKRAPRNAHDMLGAVALLCDRNARDEVAAAFAPHLRVIDDGRVRLERTLAAIDTCISRRSRLGDVAGALAK